MMIPVASLDVAPMYHDFKAAVARCHAHRGDARYHDIRGAQRVNRIGPEHADGSHVRGPRSLDAGRGVLDHDAPGGFDPQTPRGGEVAFRVWLAVCDLV